MPNRVILFSSHSIFAEGVVSRLRQHPMGGEIHFIDAQDREYLKKVADLQPSVVILDAVAGDESIGCIFCELLSTFPALTIVRLKVQERDVQVIKSSQHPVESVQDLIDLIGEK